MGIQIFNSLTRQKETFVPLEEGKVKCMSAVLQFITISILGIHVL